MIKIFTSTIIPIMSRNMALVADPSFEAVVIPALKVLTRRAVGPLGRAAIRVEGVGEIFGVGSLDPPRIASPTSRFRAGGDQRAILSSARRAIAAALVASHATPSRSTLPSRFPLHAAMNPNVRFGS